MKKFIRVMAIVLFTIAYVSIISLGIECMLNLLSLSFSASPDAGSAPSYPRFAPFCRIVGFSSLVALVGVAFLNIKISEKLNYTDNMWKLQAAMAVLLTLPMIKLWELLFEFLQKTF